MLKENSIIMYNGELFTVKAFSNDGYFLQISNNTKQDYVLSPEDFIKDCTIIGEL